MWLLLFSLFASNPGISMALDDAPNNYILFMPLYHIYGLYLIVSSLVNGKTLVIMDKFSFQHYLQLIVNNKVRHW